MTAKEVDDYLAAVPDEERAALEKLRKVIRDIVPDATETISYQIPTFKHEGALVGFAAFKNHCSFFVMSTRAMEAHKKDLEQYETSKGTIRFTVDEPLPAPLVKKLVKARIKENEARKSK